MSFELTDRQKDAQKILIGTATNIMLFGGGRSGKTFLLLRAIVVRAVKAPCSRHVVFRFRFNAVKLSVLHETFPKVMSLCFPQVRYELNKTDSFITFENGSEIWFSGLDDKERSEKVLGKEYSTVYLNECSQIPFESSEMVMTRLAQLSYTKIANKAPEQLRLKAYFDCNPPSKNHWSYTRFIKKLDPSTNKHIDNPDDYASFKINPIDNVDNIGAGYLKILEGRSERYKKRFLYGEFADANPNALFCDEIIETWRVNNGVLPEFVRIVVGVDPSGSGDSDNADNDSIGIVCGALGVDGNAYLLEDATVKCGPATWGRICTDLFDRQAADVIVGEVNYGGAMVKHVIDTARPRTPYKQVTSSRGKHLRAEPFSALYEQGKIRHAGNFYELEDELCAFSTYGYLGDRSPNRADAWIFVLAELFPGLVRQPREIIEPKHKILVKDSSWMS